MILSLPRTALDEFQGCLCHSTDTCCCVRTPTQPRLRLGRWLVGTAVESFDKEKDGGVFDVYVTYVCVWSLIWLAPLLVASLCYVDS